MSSSPSSTSNFIIRIRGGVQVQARDGEVRPASDWVPANGQPRRLKAARVTTDRYPVDSVVCVKARGEGRVVPGGGQRHHHGPDGREALRPSIHHRGDLPRYHRPTVRLGLSATHVRDARRRDRLLLICAMAMTLLTLLGAAGESLGMDRMLNANTVKTRTHSLVRQGCHYAASIPAMKQERLEPLVQRFGGYVLAQPVYVHAFCVN